jgi:hypothetical protein
MIFSLLRGKRDSGVVIPTVAAKHKTTNFARPALTQAKYPIKPSEPTHLLANNAAMTRRDKKYPNIQYGPRKRENNLPREIPKSPTRTTPIVSNHGFIIHPQYLTTPQDYSIIPNQGLANQANYLRFSGSSEPMDN